MKEGAEGKRERERDDEQKSERDIEKVRRQRYAGRMQMNY